MSDCKCAYFGEGEVSQCLACRQADEIANLRARIAELEKERDAERLNKELARTRWEGCQERLAATEKRLQTITRHPYSIADNLDVIEEQLAAERVARQQAEQRAEAAEKLAGDAVEALKELRDGVELPDRRCDPVSVTGEHRFIIDRVLSSPAAEQARERAEATTKLLASIRESLEHIIATRQADTGPCDGMCERCSECTAKEALQRLDAAKGGK